MNFILKEDSDDTEMLKYVIDDETDMKTIKLLIKWRQATQANRASSSSKKLKKKKIFIKRDRKAADEHLYRYYFTKYSMYNEAHFRRRFQMLRYLFTRIVDALSTSYEYF